RLDGFGFFDPAGGGRLQKVQSACAAPPELNMAPARLRRESLRLTVSSRCRGGLRGCAASASLAEAHAKRERRLAGCSGRFSTLPCGPRFRCHHLPPLNAGEVANLSVAALAPVAIRHSRF